MKHPSRGLAVLLIAVSTYLSGCATLEQMQNAITNLRRLQFKLDSVTTGTLAEVKLRSVLKKFLTQNEEKK